MSADLFNLHAELFESLAAVQFPDVAAVSRPTVAVGSSGGQTKTHATLSGHGSIPCLYMPLSGNEAASVGQIRALATHEVLMPARVGGAQNQVAAKDRLVVAARGTEPAKTFEIDFIKNVSAVLIKAVATLVS